MTVWAFLMGLIGLLACPIVESVAGEYVARDKVKWVVLVWMLLWTVPPLFLLWARGVFG